MPEDAPQDFLRVVAGSTIDDASLDCAIGIEVVPCLVSWYPLLHVIDGAGGAGWWLGYRRMKEACRIARINHWLTRDLT